MIQTRSTTKESLHALAAGGTLYAVVDACGCPPVPEKSADLGPDRAFCLYTGEARERAASAGPYLFHANEAVLKWIEDTLWTEPWGVLLASREPIAVIGKHFERLLVVQLPDGKKRAFRFYDPRILKPFLETCTKDQLRTFFGPVRAFGIGSDAGADFYTEDPALAHGASTNYFTSEGYFPVFDPQMVRFQQTVDERLRGDLVSHLKEKHATTVEAWPPEMLEQRATAAIASARRYGVNDTQSLKSFLSLMVEISPSFAAHPPIHAMLADPNTPSHLRVRAAVSRVPATEWNTARAQRDETAWGSH